VRTDPLLVCVTAALISVPVVLESLVGDRMPLETALLRCGVILLVTWAGIAALGLLLGATEAPAPASAADPVPPPSDVS
jgi:hypothetical protein